MNKKKLLFITSCMLILFSCSNTVTNDENDISYSINSIPKKITNSNNDFGFNLFRTINTSSVDSSIFISPISVSIALGMTMNGAAGETYDQMRDVLCHTGLEKDKINASYKALIEELYNLSEGVEFNLANSIWYRDDCVIKDDFRTFNVDNFQAKIEALDFSKEQESLDIINGWVEDQTNDKIKNLVEEIDGLTVMFLINAIYLKADWKYQFDEEETKEDYFTIKNGNTVICQMMSNRTKYDYYEDDNIQAIDIPYANENYSLTIILPKNIDQINSLVQDMSSDIFNDIVNNFDADTVNFYFPKLEIEYKKKLKSSLMSMGMILPFGGNADFSEMFENTSAFIKRVVQKSYLKINEEGTEAAAATMVEMWEKSGTGDEEELTFKVNKPFLMFIREKQSGTILFTGKIMEPVWEE